MFGISRPRGPCSNVVGTAMVAVAWFLKPGSVEDYLDLGNQKWGHVYTGLSEEELECKRYCTGPFSVSHVTTAEARGIARTHAKPIHCPRK